MFTKTYNVERYGELHHPHTEGHVHPTGVGRAAEVRVMRSYRISAAKVSRISQSENYNAKVESMLKIWLFRYTKTGHIPMSDSMEMTIDRESGVLYIHYNALETDKEWACMFSSKVVREMNDRAERDRQMEDIAETLGEMTDRVTTARESKASSLPVN